MESTLIFKELKSEFSKYADENNQLSDVKAQRASWKFGVYPSTSQIYEIHSCRKETKCFHNLEFYEYCLLIATIKNEVEKSNGKSKFKIAKPKALNDAKSRWDVFLGGACNPTTWRFDFAIPFLKERNITFYNPQVSQWDPSLIEIEERAKQTARVQFFVLDIYRTRGIASLVEAAYLSGQGCNLVLVVPAERPVTMKEVDVKEIDENEFQSISRSYLFIADLVQRQGIPLFTSVEDALKATRVSLISNRMVQNLTEIDGVVPVKHAYVNVSSMIKMIDETFKAQDHSQSGLLLNADVKSGLSLLFGRDVDLISRSKEKFTFSDFCIEYSVLLLFSIIRHKETIRSQSVIDFNLRSNSMEDIATRDSTDSLNLKDRLSSHEEDREKALSVANKASLRKALCINENKKSSTCFKRMIKWPFSRLSTTNNESLLSQASCQRARLVPRDLTREESYDIFLGGTCGDSNWRERIAIPLLIESGCKYYDPKVTNTMWSRRLLPTESQAREQSKILVYVITNECTSTAALVEAAHFIGQGKKILLHVQLLSSVCSTPLTPMEPLLQSSCSFPFSSSNGPNQKSVFFQSCNTDSLTSGYLSNSDVSSSQEIVNCNSLFSLPSISNKMSLPNLGPTGSSDDLPDLGISINNISRTNPIESLACKDHNRGRKYLIDLASRAKVPVLSTIEETIRQAIRWSQKPSPSSGWEKKSTS